MDLYLPNHYLDMAGILRDPHPFIIVVGARGTGKTYGALTGALDLKKRFMYFRRTQKIIDAVTDPALHIFKRINSDRQLDIAPQSSRGLVRFMDGDETIGYAAGLSTFANVRGFDGSDIDLIIYDEFIPEPTERVMFNAYTALLNAIETIGRNRELEGREPVKTVLLSNSDLIYSDIVSGLKIGDRLLAMQESGVEILDVSPELLLIRPAGEAFREMKKETALYRLTAGGAYSSVALDNAFPIEDRDRIKSRPLAEYKPIAAISGICLYKHKTGSTWYVTDRITGAPKLYASDPADEKRFIREQGAAWKAHIRRKVFFSGVDVQTRFKQLFE